MIICDDREPENIRNELDCTIKRLDVGDYIIGDLLIERKTPLDFFGSLFDKRLWAQLQNLKDAKGYIPLLIIEGNIWRGLADRSINGGSNTLFGTFKTIIKSFRIPILQFDDSNDFKSFLRICDREKGKSSIPLPVKKGKTLKEQRIFALSHIKGVSYKTAKSLLDKFGSIKKLSNIKEEDIVLINGIGTKLSKNIIEFLN